MTILCSLDERYSYLIHVPYIQRGKVHWLCKTGKVVSCTVQTRHNLTPKQTQSWPWVCFGSFFFLFVSALGLIRVSTWGSLYALKCEADPLFTYHPLYIPNIGTYVEKFGHFSVAIYWLLLNWGLLSMSALDGSAWVMQPLQTLKWQRKKTRGLIVFGWLCVRFGWYCTIIWIPTGVKTESCSNFQSIHNCIINYQVNHMVIPIHFFLSCLIKY